MFKCIYILDGECQLLSKPCHDRCKMKGCHSCHFERCVKVSDACKGCEYGKVD